MTLAQLKTMNKYTLGEVGYNHFSEAEHVVHLNAAIEDVAAHTKYCRSEDVFTTTATEEEIPYPTDAIAIVRIEYDGEELAKTSRDKLDSEDADWEDADGGPPEEWYPDRNLTFGLKPAPDVAYDITIFSVSKGNTLTNPTDTPNIPSAFHRMLSLFACGNMKREDGEVDASRSLFAEYNRLREKLAKLKKTEEHRSSGPLISLAGFSNDIMPTKWEHP